MITIDESELATRQVLVVSDNGFGKRSSIMDENGEYEYRMVSRGGKGVKDIQVTEKTGDLVAIKDVSNDDHLMIITRNGITIRMGLDQMRVMGRATQGVRLIELREGDRIAAVAKVGSELHDDTEGPATAASGPVPEGPEGPVATDDAPDPGPDGTDVAGGSGEEA
jgi:DNA gyrase subunit A